MTYIEEIIEKNKDVELTYKKKIELLREMLGDDKVIEIFDELADCFYNPENLKSDKYNENEYMFYWSANSFIEIDRSKPAEDGIKYPNYGTIDGEFWSVLSLPMIQFDKLKDISASSMTIYKTRTCYDTKGIIWLRFDTIESFNHFLWAGCFRFMPFSKSSLWRLQPDLGDPDYNEKLIKMELHYCDLEAKKDKIEKDVRELAECIENYVKYEESETSE